MREIIVSDSNFNEGNIVYLYGALGNVLSDFSGKMFAETDELRSVLKLRFAKEYGDYLRSEVEDKIADVLAVRYKYEFFRKNIKAGGLSELETEILYSALIAADIDEDKRYIMRKLRSFSEYAIDGVYNFRLSPLKKKWEEIVGYIPTFFPSGRLGDFVSYLIEEKRGKQVTVEGGNVYDKHYNVLRRTELTGELKEGRILREVILSGCGDLRLLSPVPQVDERYLKEYFGGRITFC